MALPRIRVLIIDDSAVARRSIRGMLEAQTDIEVVGEVGDAFRAKAQMETLRPDVLTLDIEMPGMDGLTFLRRIQGPDAPRVVIVSSISTRGSQAAVQAMSAGASEVVPKPAPDYPPLLMREDLARAVRAAAAARRFVHAEPRASAVVTAVRPRSTTDRSRLPSRGTIIALGASTGGTVALERILERLGASAPPIVIVQHMPPLFTKALAHRLNDLCELAVREAQDGDILAPGLALIAPGGKHMRLRTGTSSYTVAVESGERVSGHCPSIDILFDSVARTAGERAIGGLLTGMGSDGAKGLLAIRMAGGCTIAQSASSCAVYGMPRAAFELGAATEMVHLDEIAERLGALAT